MGVHLAAVEGFVEEERPTGGRGRGSLIEQINNPTLRGPSPLLRPCPSKHSDSAVHSSVYRFCRLL